LDFGVSWVIAGLDDTASETATANTESEMRAFLVIIEYSMGDGTFLHIRRPHK
jgi:hypothetical protein